MKKHISNSSYILKRFKICKLKNKRKKIVLVITMLIILLSLIFTYFSKVINPIILQYSNAEIEKFLIKSMNYSITHNISNTDYGNIVKINYDKEGNIISLHANQILINEISIKLANLVQEEIDKKSKMGIEIPVGTCSGIGFLSGLGQKVTIAINPIGNAFCEFKSEFNQAGISQTRHEIFVKLTSEIDLTLPFIHKKITKNISLLLSECIIIGKVPTTYLNIGNLKDFK